MSYLTTLSIDGDITPIAKKLFTRSNSDRLELLRIVLANLLILYDRHGLYEPMYLGQNTFNVDGGPFDESTNKSRIVRGLVQSFINNPDWFAVKVNSKYSKRIKATKDRSSKRPATEVSMTPKLYGYMHELGLKLIGISPEATQLLEDTQTLRKYYTSHSYKIGDQEMDCESIRRTTQKDGSLGRITAHPWLTQTRSGIDCSDWSINGDTDLVMLDFDQFAPRSLAILNDLAMPSDPYPSIKSVCGGYQLSRDTVKGIFAASLSNTEVMAHVLPKALMLPDGKTIFKRQGSYRSKAILDSLIKANPVIGKKYELAPNKLTYQYRSLESDLMMSITKACMAFDIGICGIHDGVFCRRKDAEQVKSFMLSAVNAVLSKRGLSHRVQDLAVSVKQSLSKSHKPLFIDEPINK